MAACDPVFWIVDDSGRPGRPGDHYTIESLRLDLGEATAGRTWLILPEGFRDIDSGKTYPLPSRRLDLQKLAAIIIPRSKRDSGCTYLKRARAEWRRRSEVAQSVLLDSGRREKQMQDRQKNYNETINDLRKEAREMVETVRAEVAQAIASLNDLFDLGRKGIDGQMRAHLSGQDWQGEKIDARAFRECFRMVSQAVKGLGLPSAEREKARDAIMEEYAASLEATKDAVALSPGAPGDPEVEN